MGIILAISSTLVFALQDAASKYLAGNYNVLTVLMIRYWGFLTFALIISSFYQGGIRQVAHSATPKLQIIRGILLAGMVCIMVWSFVNVGLINTHIIFASNPIIVTILSVLFLREKAGWQRWAAVVAGFIGVAIILNSTASLFNILSFVPLLCAFVFASYQILTRYASYRDKSQTSFLWTGIGGALVLTIIGPFFWTPMQGAADWLLMGTLCITGALSHYLIIRALTLAEASSIQPFLFLPVVFVSILGITFFDEQFTLTMLLGATIVVSAGIFIFWRENKAKKAMRDD